MAPTKILIAVKTYPTLSAKYEELVCTAGFLEDGSWIRIYPVPYRKLKYAERYRKWQWIELDIVKNTSDFRKESYRPTNIENEITLGDVVGVENNWAERKKIALKNVCYNMTELIKEAKNKEIGTSLAVLKPTEIMDFVWEKSETDWDKKKLSAIIANQAQLSFFEKEETKKIFEIAQKIPYKFSYIFKTEDGKTRKLLIEDWELGMLYLNCLKKANGDEIIACNKVKEKYFDEFVKKCDLYFFLGTTKKHHNTSKNPFIIIGAFYPKKENTKEPTLF